jgi:amidophosphoribosyltransferase
MCGLAGIVFGQKRRTRSELDYFRRVFAYMLLLSEERGPHATGAAWLKSDGKYRILKRPQLARDFCRDSDFGDLLAGVDSSVTWLAGHTRWQTRGDASNNLNNHPILAGTVIGTHNGTVLNADELFKRFDLRRLAEVDSEVIFRMADDSVSNRRIDIALLKTRLALCKGGMSAVMASRHCPKEIVVIKGGKPLEVRYSKEYCAVVYASSANYLNISLAEDKNWMTVDLNSTVIVRFTCDCLEASTWEPFDLASLIQEDRF